MLTSIEISFLDFIQQNIRNSALDAAMKAVTHLGDYGLVFILLCIVLLCVKKTRKCGAAEALALITTFLTCNVFLKNIVARTRPFDISSIELLINPPGDFSFPSGHTAISFAFAFALRGFYKKSGNAAIALAVLIALSRMYLYVHFPTDVAAGAVIGAAAGAVWARVISKSSLS